MISFVYFDVGGVVIDDFSGNDKWQQLKTELGVTSQSDATFEKLWEQYSPELNTHRDTESLLSVFRAELGLKLPSDYLLLDGFVNRFEANPNIWPLIKRVKQKAMIGLLTNMYPGMFKAIERKMVMPNIQWNVVLDSSIEQLQKPDRKLFELAEKRAGAYGAEILFIDNSPGHINEAASFGWQTFLYESGDHRIACDKLNGYLHEHGLT